MFAEKNNHKINGGNSLINQELYRVFVSQSSEAIWRIELESAVSVNLPADEQIELFYRDAYLAECNLAMARMYGYEAPEEIIGARLGDLLVREDESNVEYLRAFVSSGYRLEDAESHEVDRDGNPKFFLNNLIGIVENGFMTRAWGTQRDITERKEIERSKAHLAAIVEFSDDAIISKDLDGTITSWNKGAEKIFGYKSGEVIGKSITILVPPHLLAEETEILENIRKGRTVEHFETVRQRKDGSLVSLSLSVSPIKNEAGEVIGASKIARDITERKQAEVQMRRNHETFYNLVQNAPFGIYIVDADFRLIQISTGSRKVFSSVDPLIGRDFAEILRAIWEEPFASEAIEHFRHTLATGEPYHAWDTTERRGDIEDIESYDWKIERVTLPDGQFGAVCYFYDLTEQKQTEQALRESEERFAKAFNSSPLVLTITSLKTGKLLEVNDTFVRTTGYTREETIGRTTAELDLWANPDDRVEELAKVQKAGEIHDLEYRFRIKDGREIIGLLSAELLEIRGEPCVLTVIQDITERRKNEEIVRQSEEQLRQMADAMPQVVWIADSQSTVHYYNNRVTEFSGVKENSDGRYEWQPGIHPDDLPATMREWQKAREKKRGYAREHRIRMADGTYRWHLSRAVPVFDPDGEVLKWYGTMTDINDIKQTEEALRESEQRFRSMANSAPMLVWMSGTDNQATYFNQTWLDFTGRTIEQESGSGWIEGIHREDHEESLQTYSAAFDLREDFEMEFRLRRFDDEYRWILVKGVPLFTHNGTFRGYISSCIDVTERREAQETLLKAERRASEEYLELLSRIVPVAQTLGTARDLISVYRALHGFVRASMPCTAFFVSSYNAEKRLRVAEYVWGEDGEVETSSLPPMPLTEDGGPNSQAIFQKKSVVVNRYWDFMKTRPHLVLQEDGQDPNSSLVVPMTVQNRIVGTLEVQAYQEDAFTNEHIIALEMVANLAAVAIENVRLLQVEAEARESAEAANRAKDEFLSVLSHELRTPLNSMLGWTRMLRAGILDEEKTRKAIEVIERNTLLQNNLIEDLLDVSRIISGKMRIEKESVDLVKVFHDSIEILRPFAAQKNIAFEIEVTENSLVINGDATRIQQIISNLAQNAVKFTDEGGSINVSLSRHGDAARFIVKDNGIGIAKELLPFIFERFRQADSSTKRAFSGLGLGLTIVSNLVDLHGGTITADSEGAGRGATFTVELPLTEEFLEKTSVNGKKQIAVDGNSALAGARILLVDDDVESLVPLQLFLEREKAEIVTATSAKEALDRLAAQNFHILITDIGMPLADGYDLIARVRQLQTEKNAFITAIALTAYASSDDRRRALAAGFQGHLAKPVDYDELLSVIKGFYEKVK